eukprot:CAMPEP_0178987464 /NCGR_PEP_ID=MMETSP0795-20121207/3280_1 /TAXON_ID=88552 /ORGANISM="Amoebophrya sp., Strain Ameob2" /LENGTH=131 /DNA_ID=CAMNT_0020678651 /DNA_START=91 /DNA_END=487 /DNA_ORIENTATION=-
MVLGPPEQFEIHKGMMKTNQNATKANAKSLLRAIYKKTALDAEREEEEQETDDETDDETCTSGPWPWQGHGKRKRKWGQETATANEKKEKLGGKVQVEKGEGAVSAGGINGLVPEVFSGKRFHAFNLSGVA